MDEEYKNDIIEYWDYLDKLDEKVRKAVLLVWDETGRSVNELYIGVAELLDNCETFDQFYEMYRAFLGKIEKSDYELMKETKMYWHIYMRGLKRVGLEAKRERENKAETNNGDSV